MAKNDIILLSPGDIEEVVRGLKYSAKHDEEQLKYLKEGVYKDFCQRSINRRRAVCRELETVVGSVMIRTRF